MSATPKEAKQVIVVIKSLNMRKGKIAAQVAHASMGVVLKMFNKSSDFHGTAFSGYLRAGEPAHAWLNGPFTKICVSVETEEELLALVKAADEAGIINCFRTCMVR